MFQEVIILSVITYDGTYFYGIGRNQRTFYTLDLKSQQLINTSTLPIYVHFNGQSNCL
jgi:hypothetical protein